MACKGSGHSNRNGISSVELERWFPDVESARQWFESVIWKDGRICPRCSGNDIYRVNRNSNKVPYRCRDFKRYFSVKTGTVLQSSNLPLQKWVWAIFLKATSLTGMSSMKLHRNLGISQKSARQMLHRIREELMSGIQETEYRSKMCRQIYCGRHQRPKYQPDRCEGGFRYKKACHAEIY